ncbi:hypothetical protein KP509_38G051600 [Ceratopteris richardii]|uniref:Uncharacterized protein n=1 Tax=Ceratopteris richardii TaxID=49495 RepID=A0A8T2Q4T4_CERRI|nr:hypothetical protein KP509_38G051600 [Ceratopteris richardii]
MRTIFSSCVQHCDCRFVYFVHFMTSKSQNKLLSSKVQQEAGDSASNGWHTSGLSFFGNTRPPCRGEDTPSIKRAGSESTGAQFQAQFLHYRVEISKASAILILEVQQEAGDSASNGWHTSGLSFFGNTRPPCRGEDTPSIKRAGSESTGAQFQAQFLHYRVEISKASAILILEKRRIKIQVYPLELT